MTEWRRLFDEMTQIDRGFQLSDRDLPVVLTHRLLQCWIMFMQAGLELMFWKVEKTRSLATRFAIEALDIPDCAIGILHYDLSLVESIREGGRRESEKQL